MANAAAPAQGPVLAKGMTAPGAATAATLEDIQTQINNWPKRNALSKVMRRNSCATLASPEELEKVKGEIKAQSEALRTMKAAGTAKTSPNQFWEHVFRLLELKYTYDINSPVPVTDREYLVPTQHNSLSLTFKVRWRVVKPDGTSVRLQRPFQNRTTITGAEVRDAIESYTAARIPDIAAGFLKIEFPEELARVTLIQSVETTSSAPAPTSDTDAATSAPTVQRKQRKAATSEDELKQPRVWRAMTDKDIFRMPLWFPGPRLASTGVVECRVTYCEPFSHISHPESYTCDMNIIPELIDTGVNLNEPEFQHDRGVLYRATTAGISQLVCLSVDLETSKKSKQLSRQQVNTLFPTAGVHPHYVDKVPLGEGEDALQALLHTGGFVAVGECGLSYESECKTDHSLQKKWFAAQLKMAAENKLPVVIHEREAFNDLVEVFTPFAGQAWPLPLVLLPLY
eukprot:TRINITY_DN2509_c0_g1_i1.p1 TRINITY_DN2509_c0_g1~~TRINITY_DN2509_c0_g1_i1.p1  ORF type:complete len:465 (-),score=105.87 TRINITY_DN2509_c0_g1_i1:895-2262(-)